MEQAHITRLLQDMNVLSPMLSEAPRPIITLTPGPKLACPVTLNVLFSGICSMVGSCWICPISPIRVVNTPKDKEDKFNLAVLCFLILLFHEERIDFLYINEYQADLKIIPGLFNNFPMISSL